MDNLNDKIKKYRITGGTNGYLLGQTVFSKEYAVMTKKALIYIPAKNNKTAQSIAYKDIVSISLHGWMFLSLHIRTKAGVSIRVSPISRLVTTDSGVLVTADTTGEYYLKYTALFHHFTQALQEHGVDADIINKIGWRVARLRRVVSATFMAVIIFAVIINGYFWATGSKFVWTF